MGAQAGIFLEQFLVVVLGLKRSYSVSKRVVGFSARHISTRLYAAKSKDWSR